MNSGKKRPRKESGIAESSGGRTRTPAMNAIPLFTGGSILLALLTVLPNPTIANAAPFLSPAEITISPTSGTTGTEITVKGEFFAPLSTVSIRFDGDSVSTSPETVSVKKDGKFSAKFIVPDIDTDDDEEEKTVRATDDSIFSNSASASFEVTGTGGSSNEEEEDEPTGDGAARSMSITIDEDTSKLVTLRAAHRNDGFRFMIVDGPSHGVLSEFDSQTGTVVYSPNEDYSGRDRFTFKVERSDVVGTVSITITEIDDRPTAGSQQVKTIEESSTQITLIGTDVDTDDTITFSIVSVPSHGRLTGIAPHVTYLPDKDYFGLDSFSFRTSDGVGTSDIASVTIRVTGVNDPPLLDDETRILTKENDDIRITLIATDSDSDFVSFSLISGPEHGTLSRPMTTGPHVAIATYTPNPDYAGQDAFTFIVNDGSEDNGISNTGRVSILVGSSANIDYEPISDKNDAAESPVLSSSTEGSGIQADSAGNGGLVDVLIGDADSSDNNLGSVSSGIVWPFNSDDNSLFRLLFSIIIYSIGIAAAVVVILKHLHSRPRKGVLKQQN